MDMGKYVAVGVLAVIVLAAVTYEAPKDAAVAGGPSGQVEGVRVEGAFGALTPPRAEVVRPAAPTPAQVASSQPTTSAPAPVATPAPTPTQAPTTQVASAPRGDVRSFTVKAGQTLSDVAQELLGDRGRWREVYEANRDRIPDPDHVRAGLTLIFPTTGAATSRPASSPRETVATPAGGKSYTVAKGDTLYSIARKELGNGNRWREIKTLNRLASENVAAGTVLALPSR